MNFDFWKLCFFIKRWQPIAAITVLRTRITNQIETDIYIFLFWNWERNKQGCWKRMSSLHELSILLQIYSWPIITAKEVTTPQAHNQALQEHFLTYSLCRCDLSGMYLASVWGNSKWVPISRNGDIVHVCSSPVLQFNLLLTEQIFFSM